MQMKQRAKKKYIPHGLYCDGCRWWQFIGIKLLHRNPDELDKVIETHFKDADYPIFTEKCEYDNCSHDCWSEECYQCKERIVRCNYLNYTDKNEDTLLWDGCKECGVHSDFNRKRL